jgi:hypothetical protein
VIDYVLNGFFDVGRLDSELTAEIKKAEDPITKSVRTLFYEWFELNDDKFNVLVKDVLNYIREGKISISVYPAIFWSLSNFSKEGLIEEDLNTLVEFFKQGVKKAFDLTLASWDGTTSLSVSEPLSGGERTEEYKEIEKITEGYINEIKERSFRQIVEGIFDLLPNKAQVFSARLLSVREHYWSKPVFKYYSMEKLCTKLSQSDNKTLVKFRGVLHKRYMGIKGIEEQLFEDAENLGKLSELLAGNIADKKRKLSASLLEKISETAKECSEFLSKYSAKRTNIAVGQ